MNRALTGLLFLTLFLISAETSVRMLRRNQAHTVSAAEKPLLVGTVACSLVFGIALVALLVGSLR